VAVAAITAMSSLGTQLNTTLTKATTEMAKSN
jgi:Flp pilus assembly pilin Flp